MSFLHDPLSVITVLAAGLAASLLLWFLIKRPALERGTKLVLLLGLGIFPITAAGTGNVAGFQQTQSRRFCGSCHVMKGHTGDSANLASNTLAASHARNELFGQQNCYVCHSDYGMFHTVTTKLNGMRHVYEYYVNYKDIPLAEALPTIHLYRPYPNANCIQCHSTTLEGWRDVPDHQGLDTDLRSGRVSCASAGCHGPAHPFSKPVEP